MKDKSNPELTEAQKIMMIIANAMPVVADGANKGSDVYNIWKGKTPQAVPYAYAKPYAVPNAAPNAVPPNAVTNAVPFSQASDIPQNLPVLGKKPPNGLHIMLIWNVSYLWANTNHKADWS